MVREPKGKDPKKAKRTIEEGNERKGRFFDDAGNFFDTVRKRYLVSVKMLAEQTTLTE